jgi:hypothetical protein
MELNSGEYKQKQDYDTILYNSRIISLDDESMEDVLPEIEHTDPLTDEEKKYRDRIWSDIKKVCGGQITVDFLIMYQHIYLGDSFRKIGERFSVSHMAVFKRFKKVVQKLRFLYGVDSMKVPYKRREGSKL